MSPKKQVLPLSYLCSKNLSNLLIRALRDDEGKYIHEVRKYMSATNETLQALLHVIRVTIRVQGKRLQHLNLRGVYPSDNLHLLSPLVSSLTNLKSLLLPYVADDSVIDSLGNFRNLVTLDISGEACYTANGIRLLKSNTLRYLDIGRFGKPNISHDSSLGYKLVAELIGNLPNLNVLNTYSFTGRTILHQLKQDDNFKTKLIYLQDTGTDVEILEAILKACPLLERAHINCPEEGVVERLGEIRRLHSLKLTKGDGKELTTFLRAQSIQLKRLELHHIQKDALDLSELCKNAPELSTLRCCWMDVKMTNPYSIFMNIERIHILYCDIVDEVVRTVLTNTPVLKSIAVGCTNMTDGDMFRLLADCTFENLEKLSFSEAHRLTVISVQLLAEKCPKLKILGCLIGWDISPDEMGALRILVAESNTDLIFIE